MSKEIYTKRLYTIDEIKRRLTPIFIQFGLKKAAVIGSYAQNTAKPDSDIDILISTKKVFDLETYSDFEEKIQQSLNKNVDLVFYDYINPHMKDIIIKEAVAIYDEQ